MKKYILIFLVSFLFCRDTFFKLRFKYVVSPPDIPSEEGSNMPYYREDKEGRLEYLRRLTADPKTGEIPLGIYKGEQIFSKKIEDFSKTLRREALDFSSSGPSNVGGRTRAVALDVRNENIILSGGVSSGIWKSTDGGISWKKTTSPDHLNNVTCLVQDTRLGKEDIWYYGTGELVGNSASGRGALFRGNGIFKSEDNGESWASLASTRTDDPHVFSNQFQYVWDLVLNPDNTTEDEIFAAVYGGIFRSIDGGNTWNLEIGDSLSILNEDDERLNNVDFSSAYTSIARGRFPSDTTVIYYAALSALSRNPSILQLSDDAGIYISLDGEDWDNLNVIPGNVPFNRIVIGMNPSNPLFSYFLMDAGIPFLLQIRWFRDGSGVFYRLNDLTSNISENVDDDLALQGSYNMHVSVHPNNSNIVYVGGTNLFRSTDGFQTVENSKQIGGYNVEGEGGAYPNHHPDQHDLIFYPSNPNKILSANDGGLMISEDGLADEVKWRNINNGYVTSQFYTIAQAPNAESQAIIGGTQDNGTYLTQGERFQGWDKVLGGDGSYTAISDQERIFLVSVQRGRTFRLTFDRNGEVSSFARIDPEGLVEEDGSEFLFINPFVIHPINPNNIYMAGGIGLYVNDNISQIPGGSENSTQLGWKRVGNLLRDNSLITALSFSSDGDRLYYGTSSGLVFKLEDTDISTLHKPVEITKFNLPFNANVSNIAVDPEDHDHLLIIFSNYNIPSIFASNNGGSSFVDVSGNLEENPDGSGDGPSIRCAEIVPLNNGKQYLIGTSTGLYSTKDLNGSSTEWAKESIETLGESVIPMMDYRTSDGRLLVATHGNGVFTTKISDFKRIRKNISDTPSLKFVSAQPNPFQNNTNIYYQIPEDGEAKIDIYSTDGKLIKHLLWDVQFHGINSVTWDGTNSAGTQQNNGVYICRLEHQNQSSSIRLILSN